MNFDIRKINRRKKRKSGKKSKSWWSKQQPQVQNALKTAALTFTTIILMAVVYFGDQAGSWFKASVLDLPQPFNGTVLPVSKVPNWITWGGNHSTRYEDVSPQHLIDLPPYNPTLMQTPIDDLEWGNPDHDFIRNSKITYSSVFLGNYEYDHVENAGSHVGIDIKLPIGTPLHAIANGKVVKVAHKNTGFGNHIVIKHINVPDPKNPGTLTTMYSGYNHLDSIDVIEGQNVLKGQIIGKSGMTGAATGPHLHFQIDYDTAPWHPYWPFSFSEAQEAGLSFYEAINAGLGMNNAKQHSVNPMPFITANIGSFTVASADINDTGIAPTPVDEPTTNEEVTETAESTEEPEVEVVDNPFDEVTPEETGPSPTLFSYKISGETLSLVNNGVTLVVKDEGDQISELADDDEIRIEVDGVGRLIKKRFYKSDFNNGEILVSVTSDSPGVANVLIGKSSHQVQFIDKVNTQIGFTIDHDGNYQRNILETIQVIAVDENGKVTPSVSFNGVANVTITQGEATVIPEQLTSRDFENGIATIKIMVPNENAVQVRVQNGALVGESVAIHHEEKELFTDVTRSHPNYAAIKSLRNKGIVSGYGDGSFQPNKTVNRAEAIKMLLTAFQEPVVSDGSISFSDVDPNAWFAPSIEAAAYRNIVSGYDDGTFRPANTVNKVEYLKMLLNTASVESTDPVTTKPYDDVDTNAWFAPYAFLANRMNLVSVQNNQLNPGAGMTRADVAESIYRMLVIKDGNLLTYSE